MIGKFIDSVVSANIQQRLLVAAAFFFVLLTINDSYVKYIFLGLAAYAVAKVLLPSDTIIK